MTKNGFKAEVIIPADTAPEKGFKAEFIIPVWTGSEERFKLLVEIAVSTAEVSFALLSIVRPKSSITKPPIIARYEKTSFSRKAAAPIRIIKKIVSSTRAWPIKIEGPALQPFLTDAPIVANVIGPGIRAAEMPTVNPRIRALISSIMV